MTDATRLVGDTSTITVRNLWHFVRQPDRLLFSTIQPVMFVLLFVFVFGGAIEPSLPPGVDYVNFRRPLMAGDTVRGRTTVLSKRISSSKPGLGFISVKHELFNQHGDLVCDMANSGMFLLREPGAAE